MKTPQYVYHGIVTKVVDGDTIDVAVHLGFMVSTLIRFRLNAINTMEVNDTDPSKRALAQKAKQYMIDKVLDRTVIIQSYKTDKYGRWLADIYVEDEVSSINTQLLEEGLAEPYNGGKR